MWFSVVCTLIDNDTRHHRWSKCCGLARRNRGSHQNNHNDIDFLPQYQRQRKRFLRARAEEGIA